MVTCTVCGEHNFSCVDGLYYCSACSTQSQDVRQEEQDDELTFASLHPQCAIKAPRAGKVSKPQTTVSLGRPWATTELVQLILREQVAALQNLGASPHLSTVAFKLWCMYMGAVGYAFTNDPEEKKLHRQFGQREREILKPSIKCQAVLYASHENSSASPGTAVTANASHGDGGQRRADVNPDVDEMEDLSHSDGDSSSNEDECLTFKREELLKPKPTRYTSRPEVLGLKTAIGVCYLSLLYTNNLTTVADIIRWISEGKIPYLNADKLLPSDMQFSAYDHTMFSSARVPTSSNLRRDAHGIARLIGLNSFSPIDLSKLCSKYILCLYLPGDTHRLVHKLIALKPPTLQYVPADCKMPNYDAIAMAYIIVTLKLIFGLDDQTEVTLSDYARFLNSLRTPSVLDLADGSTGHIKQQYFIWEDWTISISQHIYSHRWRTELPDTFAEAALCPDVESCLKTFEHLRAPARRHTRYGRGRKLFQSDTREKLSRPFANLNAILSTTTARDSTGSTERGGVCEVKAASFVRHSLVHVADDDTIEGLTSSGIAKIATRLANECDGENGVNHSLPERYTAALESRKNYMSYTHLRTHPGRPTAKRDLFPKWIPPYWHRSYYWLLELCASMICSDCLEVDNEVRNVEVAHLGSHAHDTTAKIQHTKMLRRRYGEQPR